MLRWRITHLLAMSCKAAWMLPKSFSPCLTVSASASPACSLSASREARPAAWRRNPSAVGFFSYLTCNSWVLSSLGRESTKTCHPVEVSCKHQSNCSPLCPWQSWRPFVQIIGCDLPLQGAAWKPRSDWQAGPYPGNQSITTGFEMLAPGGFQCCCRSCLLAS